MAQLAKQIFIDADVFISLNDLTELNHKKAKKISEYLFTNGFSLFTATNVLLEATTVLSQHINHNHGIKFLSEVRNGPITVIHPSQEIIFKAEKLFTLQKSKNVSYADCVSFAVMKDQGITTAFSFDRDFKKNGFMLLKENMLAAA